MAFESRVRPEQHRNERGRDLDIRRPPIRGESYVFGSKTYALGAARLVSGLMKGIKHDKGIMDAQTETFSELSNNEVGKRLERACEHVNRLWFPVNPELLRKVQSSLREGRYDFDIQFLLHDLKSDFALLTFCMRELSTILQKEGISVSHCETVQDVFDAAGIERIKKILEVQAHQISRHTPRTMTEDQAAILSGAIVSAGTAEMLSGRAAQNPETAFSAALLRQLGLTLIAWNYPSVFQRGITASKEGGSLDLALSDVLGFSPLLLAARVVRTWNLPAVLKFAVGGAEALGDADAGAHSLAAEGGAALETLCRVGEALARANDPERYPSAAREWTEVRVEIEQRLGQEGLRMIQERIADYAKEYATVQPTLFAKTTNLNPEFQIRNYVEKHLFKNNPYVNQCGPELKKKLRDLYSEMMPGQVERDLVGQLVKHIVPFAGFQSGCVYTYDPGASALIPRLKFGDLDVKPLRGAGQETRTGGYHPVLTAFDCSAPITGAHEDRDIWYIAGALGQRQRIGVVYLELPKSAVNQKDVNHMLHFKAIRQALQDCLNLR